MSTNTRIVKHFDISLAWMGKYKNWEKAAFWSADTDEGMIYSVDELMFKVY